MKITFNAPFVLTFALFALVFLLYDKFINTTFIYQYLTLLPSINFQDPLFYLRLFSYTLGHADLQHLVQNFTYMLLIGPYLEEKYGSGSVLSMAIVTGLFTSILYLMAISLFPIYFQAAPMVGASGIVFMMILLGSFSNSKSGTIPLTFLFILVFFIGNEIIESQKENNIAEFAHIVGGICGSIFGFIKNNK